MVQLKLFPPLFGSEAAKQSDWHDALGQTSPPAIMKVKAVGKKRLQRKAIGPRQYDFSPHKSFSYHGPPSFVNKYVTNEGTNAVSLKY